MIHNIARNMAFFLGEKAGYTKEKIDVCTYGIELILSDIIVILITIIAAIVLHIRLYTLLMLTTFVTLRHRAGGFHASSHLKCNVLYFVAYACFVIGIKYIPDNIAGYTGLLICILGVVDIIKYAPIEHPNKPISAVKKVVFRRQSIIFAITFLFAAILLKIVNADKFVLSIAFGVGYTALSIVAEMIKRKWRC